ncbi:sensor histidine kinase [Frankia sp. ACN1ag]|uniref:sensor histidine kinase n=1 Tax=Frankia sp. ACN1ag TaxID=102891 RepID=UPI000A774132|nr:histidine kinase [Frankia sp. ACN1ag]
MCDVTALVATAAVVIGGSNGAAQDQVPPARALDAPAFVLLILLTGTVLLRRRVPLVMLLSTSLLLGAYFAAGYPHGPAVTPLVVAALSVGLHHDRRTSWRAVLVANVALLAGSAVGDARGYATGGWGFVFEMVGGVTLCSAPALVGALIRLNRFAAAQAAQEATGRRIEQERLRMACEVHDVVGHSLSVISLQSAVALHVLDRRPEQAQVALEAIRRTSVDALDELRSTLALTRAGQQGGATVVGDGQRDGVSTTANSTAASGTVGGGTVAGSTGAADDRPHAATRAGSVGSLVTARASPLPEPPLTGLGRLPTLLHEVRLCGVPIELVTEDDGDLLTGLPADLDLAAYRIIQESLTNVLRHAPPGRTRVRVALATAGGRLALDVTDRPEPSEPSEPSQPSDRPERPEPSQPSDRPSPAERSDLSGPFGAGGSARADNALPDSQRPGGQGLTGLRERAAELGGVLSAGPGSDGGWQVRAELPLLRREQAEVRA